MDLILQVPSPTDSLNTQYIFSEFCRICVLNADCGTDVHGANLWHLWLFSVDYLSVDPLFSHIVRHGD